MVILLIRILNIIHEHLLKENNYNNQTNEIGYRCIMRNNMHIILTVCSYHVTYLFQSESTLRSVWLHGWMSLYELSGCGFESRCMHIFINKRTTAFSPCKIFSFLLMLFLWICVYRRVFVEIRHIWLIYEIYQNNNVGILNIKFNDCCNNMCIPWFLVLCGELSFKLRRWRKDNRFLFTKRKNLQKIWIKFVNRKDWEPTNSSYICIKHFEGKYYQNGEGNKRFWLIKTSKPVPTIFDSSNPNFRNSSVCQVTSPVSIPRKSPRKCVYQEDQYEGFIADNVIKNFSDINESLCR